MSATTVAQTPSNLLDAKQLPALDDERNSMASRGIPEFARAYCRIADPATLKQF